MSIHLPRQVQDASDRADKAWDEITHPDHPAEPTPAPPDHDTPAVLPEPAEAPKHTDWKAKYHTLQGMFNAEVPRLHKDLQAAQERIDELEEQLGARPAGPPDAPTEVDTPPEKIELPQELVDLLGEDVAQAIVQSVRESTKREMQPLREQVTSTDERVKTAEERRAEDTRDKFMDALTKAVPDWRDVDNTEEWKKYLSEPDPLSRQVRQALMVAAANDGDVDTVARFFEDFKQHSNMSPAPSPDTAPAPTAPEPGDDEALLRQLTPDPGGAQRPAQGPQHFTRAEIHQFYKDVALGKIKPDQAAKTEQAIIAASREGRVR